MGARALITVLTWFWKQPESRCNFTADHVNIWADMVRRHCSLDIEVACVTDLPEGIDPSVRIIAPPREFEDVRIPSWHETKPQCLRRIAMFRPDAADIFGERFACMDLDCVIGGSLDGLLSADEDFRVCQGTAKGRPYNGSFMLMTAGARPQVYTEFSPEKAAEAGKRFLGSDQAWIAHCLPGEATFGFEHGISMSFGMMGGAVRFYNGSRKPWDAVREQTCSYAVDHYRSEARGRAIYLGVGASVWDDALLAIQQPVDVVFASPEAAKHWPGPIKDVARGDEQAERLARMYGYELEICGASEGMGC